MNRELDGKRIGLLTAWASRAGGGVFEAVAMQADLIRAARAIPVVIALDDDPSQEDRARLHGAELVLVKVRGPGFIGFAPDLAARLVTLELDLLHLHGIWMYPSRAATIWTRRVGRPLVISPHGMLDPWITGRGKWKKALARAGYERASWRAAYAMHSLTEAERADIARETGRGDGIVIPNSAPASNGHADGTRARNHFVYIGRIHPKKNIVALIEAWQALDRFGYLPDGARLSIAGWGDAGESAKVNALLAAGHDSAKFLGPVFGDAKEALIRSASFIVLPSHSEGLPMAILEAWAAGRPTIMTRDCNLSAGFSAGAAIECGHDPSAIGAALRSGIGMDDDEWANMRGAALALANGPFSPDTVRTQWTDFYAAAIRNGRGPE